MDYIALTEISIDGDVIYHYPPEMYEHVKDWALDEHPSQSIFYANHTLKELRIGTNGIVYISPIDDERSKFLPPPGNIIKAYPGSREAVKTLPQFKTAHNQNSLIPDLPNSQAT